MWKLPTVIRVDGIDAIVDNIDGKVDGIDASIVQYRNRRVWAYRRQYRRASTPTRTLSMATSAVWPPFRTERMDANASDIDARKMDMR